MKKIYVVTGQTATGKTSYAIDLAKKIDGELINCDSRQVYKQLDIITGKEIDQTTGVFTLSKKQTEFDIGKYVFKESNIPIWLYDVAEPNQEFSPFDYSYCAIEVIKDILSRNKTPIIVGGTYFYLKNLLYGTIETFVEPNEQLRNELNELDVNVLQSKLKELDADLFHSLNNSEKHNPQRLIRRIEIIKGEHSSNKETLSIGSVFPDIEVEMIGFTYESKDDLKEQITKRVEKRLNIGAINEVEQLLKTFSDSDPGLQTIGYTQIISYLRKELSYEDMKQEWITKEVQYAKRQMTFMKKDTNIQWKFIDSK